MPYEFACADAGCTCTASWSEESADAILEGGVTVASQLDLLDHVVHTRDSIQQVRAGVAAYGVALDKLL